MSDLDPDAARAVGARLSSAVAAIEEVTQADRVYCLSFCEVDRSLHFHLFPRTAALLAEYHQATNTRDEAVNGPMLFEWARERFPAGAPMSASFPEIDSVCARLRALIG